MTQTELETIRYLLRSLQETLEEGTAEYLEPYEVETLCMTSIDIIHKLLNKEQETKNDTI